MFYSVQELSEEVGYKINEILREILRQKMNLTYSLRIRRVVNGVVLGEKDANSLLPYDCATELLKNGYINTRNELLTNPTHLLPNAMTAKEVFLFEDDAQKIIEIFATKSNKPTPEQLQQRLDDAQAEIEALKQQLEDATKNQSTQQKREIVLKAWVAGKGKDVAEKMVKTDIHDELKKIEPHLFGISYATFETFWKDQKILTLRAGSR